MWMVSPHFNGIVAPCQRGPPAAAACPQGDYLRTGADTVQADRDLA